ncbi:MAG: hypothetical protein V7K38_02785 [Nostoc sp.]
MILPMTQVINDLPIQKLERKFQLLSEHPATLLSEEFNYSPTKQRRR